MSPALGCGCLSGRMRLSFTARCLSPCLSRPARRYPGHSRVLWELFPALPMTPLSVSIAARCVHARAARRADAGIGGGGRTTVPGARHFPCTSWLAAASRPHHELGELIASQIDVLSWPHCAPAGRPHAGNGYPLVTGGGALGRARGPSAAPSGRARADETLPDAAAPRGCRLSPPPGRLPAPPPTDQLQPRISGAG